MIGRDKRRWGENSAVFVYRMSREAVAPRLKIG